MDASTDIRRSAKLSKEIGMKEESDLLMFDAGMRGRRHILLALQIPCCPLVHRSALLFSQLPVYLNKNTLLSCWPFALCLIVSHDGYGD